MCIYVYVYLYLNTCSLPRLNIDGCLVFQMWWRKRSKNCFPGFLANWALPCRLEPAWQKSVKEKNQPDKALRRCIYVSWNRETCRCTSHTCQMFHILVKQRSLFQTRHQTLLFYGDSMPHSIYLCHVAVLQCVAVCCIKRCVNLLSRILVRRQSFRNILEILCHYLQLAVWFAKLPWMAVLSLQIYEPHKAIGTCRWTDIWEFMSRRHYFPEPY